MGHGSVADFAVRLEQGALRRDRARPLRETPVARERRLLREKLAELTAASYFYASEKEKQRIRAEIGSRSLREWCR